MTTAVTAGRSGRGGKGGTQASKSARKRAKETAWAKKSGGWSRRSQVSGGSRGRCPTPYKRQFATEVSASMEAGARAAREPYRCPCGWWHLRTRQGGGRPVNE